SRLNEKGASSLLLRSFPMAKYCCAAAMLAAVLLLGCDGSGATNVVSGTVTFDNKPVENGDIIFEDADNKVGPDVGKIKDGKFEFKAKAGKKKVKIMATRMEPLPKDKVGGIPGETEAPVDYIPKNYNSETTLTADVPGGPYKFDLKPK